MRDDDDDEENETRGGVCVLCGCSCVYSKC